MSRIKDELIILDNIQICFYVVTKATLKLKLENNFFQILIILQSQVNQYYSIDLN